jgi:DNA-binding Lrp family transcriptional regulator
MNKCLVRFIQQNKIFNGYSCFSLGGGSLNSEASDAFFVENVKRENAKTLSGGKSMPLAFVLINAEIGAEDDVIKALDKITNVVEAYVVYGVYDIVAKVEAESMNRLKEIVTWKIRRLDRVRSTLTMIVMEGTE